MTKYLADYYIDEKTLDWVTKEECPEFFNMYIADILIKLLGINGGANEFCKCKCGGYNLSWTLDNGVEYVRTYSAKELLSILEGKVICQELKIEECK